MVHLDSQLGIHGLKDFFVSGWTRLESPGRFLVLFWFDYVVAVVLSAEVCLNGFPEAAARNGGNWDAAGSFLDTWNFVLGCVLATMEFVDVFL